MLCLARCIGGLALERGWSREGGVGLEVCDLDAQEGGLLVEVALQSLYVRQVVGEGVRSSGVVNECVCEGFGGRGRRVKCYGCRGEGVQGG